jgi:hypothetical protein
MNQYSTLLRRFARFAPASKNIESQMGHILQRNKGCMLLGTYRRTWANDFIYHSLGSRHTDTYDLFSAGPDRREGIPDDVWDE